MQGVLTISKKSFNVLEKFCQIYGLVFVFLQYNICFYASLANWTETYCLKWIPNRYEHLWLDEIGILHPLTKRPEWYPPRYRYVGLI